MFVDPYVVYFVLWGVCNLLGFLCFCNLLFLTRYNIKRFYYKEFESNTWSEVSRYFYNLFTVILCITENAFWDPHDNWRLTNNYQCNVHSKTTWTMIVFEQYFMALYLFSKALITRGILKQLGLPLNLSGPTRYFVFISFFAVAMITAVFCEKTFHSPINKKRSQSLYTSSNLHFGHMYRYYH
eukprot:UN26350